MTKGKIILGVAAAVVTVGMGLAFKTSKHSTKRVYGFTLIGNVCKQCAGLWTLKTGGHAYMCYTSPNHIHAVFGSGVNSWTWFTKSNRTNKVTKVTTTQ